MSSDNFKDAYKIHGTEPDRTDILIHVGNQPKDTRGCVIVGNNRKDNYVQNSRVTMNQLKKRFKGRRKTKLRIIKK